MSKPVIDPTTSRVETLTSALLYLMSCYHRTPCPRIALMVLRHMEAIRGHAEAPSVLRQMCAGLCGEWAAHACPGRPPGESGKPAGGRYH
ncbi:MAG: hypothetical protein ACOZDY_11545 [Pseudomonadota bacterium]